MIPHDQHPARHAPITLAARLPGAQAHGVAAAEVEVAQGTDGGWYARWAFHIPTTGCASPITHSEPFADPQAAADAKLVLIRDKARRILAARPDCYSDTDRQWCRKIEAWAVEQLGPQQMGLGI